MALPVWPQAEQVAGKRSTFRRGGESNLSQDRKDQARRSTPRRGSLRPFPSASRMRAKENDPRVSHRATRIRWVVWRTPCATRMGTARGFARGLVSNVAC